MSANNVLDYVVLGAGPAGVQLAYDMEKTGDSYILLERGEKAGTFFKSFPRHRKLISINKVYTGYDDNEINLRWDWNSVLNKEGFLFKDFSKQYFPDADKMVEYLDGFTQACKLNIQYNCNIQSVDYDNAEKCFVLTDAEQNKFYGRVLVVATGVSKSYLPNIPGAELAENYFDFEVDPQNFVNQRVLIVGKGNSAFETADSLVETTAYIHISSPNPLKFAWKTKYVGHLRAVNNNFLDTYQLKSQNVVINAEIEKIRKLDDGTYAVTYAYGETADGEVEELIYDRVIMCTGFKFDASIFADKIKPNLVINNRFPDQTHEWESTNIPHLYFAGTITQMRDFKRAQSGFVHGFRYNVAFLKHILDKKYKNIAVPHNEMKMSSLDVAKQIIASVNVSSALWQQTTYFCDLVLVKDDKVSYYRDIPKDYALFDAEMELQHKFIITLEFGKDIINSQPDVFNLKRPHKDDHQHADQSPGLHPIVYEYKNGVLVSTHHVIEDIFGVWSEDVHVEPLVNYFDSRLLMSHEATMDTEMA